jgi:hypothetical protein
MARKVQQATRLGASLLASLRGKDLTLLMSQSDMNYSRGLIDVEFTIERGGECGELVIASEAKQSRTTLERLDCFVASLLAMTCCDRRHPEAPRACVA